MDTVRPDGSRAGEGDGDDGEDGKVGRRRAESAAAKKREGNQACERPRRWNAATLASGKVAAG